jgi:hypothetical protein
MLVRGSQRPGRADPTRQKVLGKLAKRDTPRALPPDVTAAREKNLGRYFLTCGHYGTRETDELMKMWNGKGRGWHFCETCNNWLLVAKRDQRNMNVPIDELPF